MPGPLARLAVGFVTALIKAGYVMHPVYNHVWLIAHRAVG
jgi:hypothetical protein